MLPRGAPVVALCCVLAVAYVAQLRAAAMVQPGWTGEWREWADSSSGSGSGSAAAPAAAAPAAAPAAAQATAPPPAQPFLRPAPYWAAASQPGAWRALSPPLRANETGYAHDVTGAFTRAPPTLFAPQLRACLRNRVVVFVGDSLTLQMHNALTEMLTPDNVMWDFDPPLSHVYEYSHNGTVELEHVRRPRVAQKNELQCGGVRRYAGHGKCRFLIRVHSRGPADDPDSPIKGAWCRHAPTLGDGTVLCHFPSGKPASDPALWQAMVDELRERTGRAEPDLLVYGEGLHRMGEGSGEFVGAVRHTKQIIDRSMPHAARVFLGLEWRNGGRIADKYWAWQSNDIARGRMAKLREEVDWQGTGWRWADQFGITQGLDKPENSADGTHFSWDVQVAKVHQVLGGYC